MYDVFIAYGHPHLPSARDLRDALADLGIRAFVEGIDLLPGDIRDVAIPAVLDDVSVVAVLISASWAEDFWDARTAVARVIRQMGEERSARLVPLIMLSARGAQLPYGLERPHPIEDVDLDWPATAARFLPLLAGANAPANSPARFTHRATAAVGLNKRVISNRVAGRALSPRANDIAARIEELRDEEQRLKMENASTDRIQGVVSKRLELERTLRDLDALKQGTRLGKRFEVMDVIGEGSWGIVWRAFDLRLERHVAVKVLRSASARDESAVERFRRGARSMDRLAHAGIVSVIEPADEDFGHHYFVMELMARDLSKLASAPDLTQEQLLTNIIQVADAIQAAHEKGLVHRDIKPSNILLNDSGDIAKLADFDLVKRQDETHGTQTGPMGSRPYCAPEQRTCAQEAGPLADIFSLGMTLLYVLTRQELSPHMDQPGLVSLIMALRVWPELRAVVLKATRWEPRERHQSAEEFREDLINAIARRPANQELDSLLEELGSHRRCLESDLYDLLSIAPIRQAWQRVRTDLPTPSTRQFIHQALWTEQQRLLAFASDEWMDEIRPWLEETAYIDWQSRSEPATQRSEQAPRLHSRFSTALHESGWLSTAHSTRPTFGHWRLACWALAAAVARRGSLPPMFVDQIDTQMTSRRSALEHLAQPERSSEFPGDLIWNYVQLGRHLDAATVVALVWRRGWQATYLRELFVEIGPAGLWAIQSHLEMLSTNSRDSTSSFRWFEDEVPARIAARALAHAAEWAHSAISHPVREVRELSYAIAGATDSWDNTDQLIERHRYCHRLATSTESGEPLTMERQLWTYEADRAMRAIQLFVASNPEWLVSRASQLVRTDYPLACRVAAGLWGNEGRSAWLRVKAYFVEASPTHDWFLTAMLRRFRDSSELHLCSAWVEALLDEDRGDITPTMRRRERVLDDLMATLAVIAPALVPGYLESMSSSLRGSLSPATFLPGLFWRSPLLFQRALASWFTVARNGTGGSVGWSLGRLARLLPIDIVGSLIRELERRLHTSPDGEDSHEAQGIVECLTSVRSLAVLNLLEAQADTGLASTILIGGKSQITGRSGHVRGDCGPLIRRIGGEAFRDYVLTRLEHGRVEYWRAIHDLPFVPPPVDWTRVLAAEQQHGEDDFTIGQALTTHREHSHLVDWVISRGLNGPGRFSSDAEPSSGCMEAEQVERIMRQHRSGDCPTLNALLALGVTGNTAAVAAVCGIRTQGVDEAVARAAALRWLAFESVDNLDCIITTLSDEDEAVLLDVLWHTYVDGSARSQAKAESVLVSRWLGEVWDRPASSRRSHIERHERLARCIRSRFDALGWPPKGGTFAFWSRWPVAVDTSWDPFEMRTAIRNGPAHESPVTEIERYHAVDPEGAYGLALGIARAGYRDTTGLPRLLVRFDPERAAHDLWSLARDADTRRQHEIAVAMDRIEPRYAVREVLVDHLYEAPAPLRRLAVWLAGWQTDALLNDELRACLDVDLDLSLQLDQALERQRRAREAVLLVTDLHGRSPDRQAVRIDLFLELCKPSHPESPDGWAVWHRAGTPLVGHLLWDRVKNGLRGIRKLDEHGPRVTRPKHFW